MRLFATTTLLLSCLLTGCSGDSGGSVAGTGAGESSESSVPAPERVQGKWKIMGRGGKRGPRVTELTENPTAIEIVFEGDQYTHSKSDSKKFTLDPTASPKRITLNYMSGTSEEESFGIYKFRGRPVDFLLAGSHGGVSGIIPHEYVRRRSHNLVSAAD